MLQNRAWNALGQYREDARQKHIIYGLLCGKTLDQIETHGTATQLLKNLSVSERKTTCIQT